ncbi:hypothetical protein GCM10007937_09000 [Mesorhizobium albiziae]|nr:hypothetical protein GCM10007937_09000 [Mesorhizobium albiziae]
MVVRPLASGHRSGSDDYGAQNRGGHRLILRNDALLAAVGRVHPTGSIIPIAANVAVRDASSIVCLRGQLR